MEWRTCEQGAFSVIGIEGSTREGPEVVSRLWEEANARFAEVESLAKRRNRQLSGIWGLMSDFGRRFLPWEEGLTQGLYLAGVEVEDDVLPPPGWSRWTIPAFAYIVAPVAGNSYADTLADGLAYLERTGGRLAGAVQDFHCPQTQQLYLYLPVRRLEGIAPPKGDNRTKPTAAPDWNGDSLAFLLLDAGRLRWLY